jgi:ATP-dependent Clp protease protease subunit
MTYPELPGPEFPAPEFPGPEFPAPEFPGPPRPGSPGRPAGPGPLPPARVWLDPPPWPGTLHERLLAQRIVMAQGFLDDEAATRLCAHLLTLDAEADEPIRLELQGLDAELAAAVTVMGVLDTLRVPVLARVAGRLAEPALGVLAACGQRWAYPNAVLELSEPRLRLRGAVSELTAHEAQARLMLDGVLERIAEVTGHEVDEVRADARRCRFFTAEQAAEYGLISEVTQRE